ncbi:MAG: hypothetical protein PHD76_07380 [Methylacidiphilales bacterium]|nr:hypothetical protein [Candidatus Methylacidiphilales bacterium]
MKDSAFRVSLRDSHGSAVLFLPLLLCGILLPGGILRAQDVLHSEGRKIDLGDVSVKFARNMKLLEPLLPESETQQMMEVVIGKAGDLASLYRAGGGANRRRKLLDEEDALLHKPNISKVDQRRLEDLQQEIKKADPDGVFQKGRDDIRKSILELQGMLSVLHASDPDVQDVIRIAQQHLQLYQTALSKYQ